jgi:hypothetical protein
MHDEPRIWMGESEAGKASLSFSGGERKAVPAVIMYRLAGFSVLPSPRLC